MTRTLAPGIHPRPRFAMPVADLPDPPDWTEPEPLDAAFSRGPARRPEPLVRDPLLQWATGLPTRERAIYAGWLIAQGQDAALDAALDRAECASTTIRHSGGVLVTHWTLPTASLFLIAAGVQPMSELRHTSERYGIAFGWARRQDGQPCSHLRCRVFVREVLEAGYEAPLLLAVKSTLTGDLLTALLQQYRVLDAAATLLGLPDLPLYAFSLPVGPGEEVTRGSGSLARTIVPMVAHLPAAIDREYLTRQWTRQGWAQRVEGLLDATIAWSVTCSERMGGPGDA